MRVVFLVVIIVVFVLAGVVFGALNVSMVPYDFGFAQVSIPKGAAVLAALVVGWLLGGIVAWLGTGLKHRRRRARGGAGKTALADDS
jgi:uncharacterized integral membrane protein